MDSLDPEEMNDLYEVIPDEYITKHSINSEGRYDELDWRSLGISVLGCGDFFFYSREQTLHNSDLMPMGI